MPDRKEALLAFAQEILPERLEQSIRSLEEAYRKRREEIDASFLRAAEALFRETARRQAAGEKEAIAYLCISPLLCSAVSGEEDFLLAAYGADWHLDFNPVYAYWKPLLLYECLRADMAFFSAKAHAKFVQLEAYEIQQVRLHYLEQFFLLAGCFCQSIAEEALKSPAFGQVQKEEPFTVLYGEYMGKMGQLYPLKG